MNDKPENGAGKPAGVDDAIASLIRRAGPGEQLNELARQRVYRGVHAAWQQKLAADAEAARSGWWFRAAIAAGVALIAVFALQLGGPGETPTAVFAAITQVQGAAEIDRGTGFVAIGTDSATRLRPGDRVLTAARSALALDLPDGSVLRIAPDTELTVTGPERIDLESGRVYFDSAGNTAFDLVVGSRLGEVRHIGTQYEAEVAGSRLAVRVREGAAALETPSARIVATAGEAVTVSVTGAVQREALPADAPEWEWVTALAAVPAPGQLSLLAALEWLGRETGRTLAFADTATAEQAANVQLYELAGLGTDELLEVLRTTTRFEIDAAPGTLRIAARR